MGWKVLFFIKIVFITHFAFMPLFSSSAIDISDSRKKLFEGFSDNPRNVIGEIRKLIKSHHGHFERAAQGWYNLHLQIVAPWQENVKSWPENIPFRDFIDNSQVLSLSHSEHQGFLAFHRLADYPQLDKFYEDPYALNFATGMEGIEYSESDDETTLPLRSVLTQDLLKLYKHVDWVVEAITNIRLELAIITDQLTALEFNKNKGYFIRHLTHPSANFISSLDQRVEALLKDIINLRSHALLPTLHHLSGMIHAVGFAEYASTSDFKKDMLIFIKSLTEATPQLSAFARSFLKLLSDMNELSERNQVAKTFTLAQSNRMVKKIETLNEQLKALAEEENSLLLQEHHNATVLWQRWLAENQEEYYRIFHELYEILEFPSEPDTPLYKFQTQHFRLNSQYRLIYRNLEALLFGSFDPSSQLGSISESLLARKIRQRSQVLKRLILNPQTCDFSLNQSSH